MSVSTCQMKERYNQQGFLSAVPVLDDTELREARQAFNHLEREFGKEYTQYSLHNVHLQYPWVMGLAKHPHILQVVQSILGSDVILLDSRFICKYPTTPTPHPTATQAGNDAITLTSEEEVRSSEKDQQSETGLPFVAWHQDMRYWGIAGGPVLSVWLALDDSLAENGALKVIPGSHCSGMLPHQLASRPGNMLSVNQEIPEELVQTDSALLCPLLAGQMSVSHTAPLLGVLVFLRTTNVSKQTFCITVSFPYQVLLGILYYRELPIPSPTGHSVLQGASHTKSYWTFCITGSFPYQILLGILYYRELPIPGPTRHSVLQGASHPRSYWTFCITGSFPSQVLLDILYYRELPIPNPTGHSVLQGASHPRSY
uniref:Zgc:174917 n=1 Tax=Oncorhynchus mykiss TaxID=8022 RepID=A0A8C7RYZ1_ONCMY